MHIRDAVDEFLLAGGAAGMRIKTLRWYKSILGKFTTYIGEREVESITANEIRGYLVHLRQQQYSDDTLHDYGRALKRFWNWYALEHRINNPMDNVKYQKQPKPQIPKAVTPEDVIRLLAACDTTPNGKRDKALIAFLFDTGCRADEVSGLRLSEVDLEQGRAYVIGKGRKARVVSFTEITTRLLRRWLAVRNPESEYLFHGKRGARLEPNGIQQMTIRLKKKARVTGRVNPHSFRHGFAREFILNGGSLAMLSRIMGHESEEITAAYYAIFASEELVNAHRKFSPMRKLKDVINLEDNDNFEGSG